MNASAPIGLFDSGLGGLTVLREIQALLPNEDLIYLGDTARVPYGTRSPETVQKYAQMCATELLKSEVKVLVVACNTVSAVALPTLRKMTDIPVLGVIKPGARASVEATTSKRIGVLATEGTIASGAYEKAIHALAPDCVVQGVAAPLFVPLVEEGWIEGEVPEKVAFKYLDALKDFNPDTLVLGCTHYPLLFSLIEREARKLIHPQLTVVDSAQATARDLQKRLLEHPLRNQKTSQGTVNLRVTDAVKRFSQITSRFLGDQAKDLRVEQIDL